MVGLSKLLYNRRVFGEMNDHEFTMRVRALERKLYRIAHAILWNDADCADAIQEAVFKGWMKKTSLREANYFETWLIRILINECRNLMRRQKAMPLPLQEARAAEASPDPGLDLHLRAALMELPEKYRVPLLLHHFEGYSMQEIARMLNMPQALVKSRLYQARNALRKILKAGENA